MRVQRRPARPAMVQREGTITVRTSGFGKEESERTDIEVHQFQTEPAYIRINAGVTKNTGDYSSFRCDVSITMPCYQEELMEVADRVSDRVAAMLDAELEKYGIQEVAE